MKRPVGEIRAEVAKLPAWKSKLTQQEQEKAKTKIRAQINQQYENNHVVCGGECRRGIYIDATYRCLYCGVRYCRDCAQIHFGYRIPAVGEVVP